MYFALFPHIFHRYCIELLLLLPHFPIQLCTSQASAYISVHIPQRDKLEIFSKQMIGKYFYCYDCSAQIEEVGGRAEGGFIGGSRGLWFRYRYRNVYEQWWLTLISTTNGIYIAFRFHCDIVCLWGGRRWGWRRHSLFCRKQTEYCYYYVLNSHHKTSHLQSRTKRAFI